MKRWLTIGLLGLVSSLSSLAYADAAQEAQYLTQINNNLAALQPLILAAQRAQPANARIQFHYTRYRDAHGQWRNGLLEDVKAIQQGVVAQLGQPTIEPRPVLPLKADYRATGLAP